MSIAFIGNSTGETTTNDAVVTKSLTLPAGVTYVVFFIGVRAPSSVADSELAGSPATWDGTSATLQDLSAVMTVGSFKYRMQTMTQISPSLGAQTFSITYGTSDSKVVDFIAVGYSGVFTSEGIKAGWRGDNKETNSDDPTSLTLTTDRPESLLIDCVQWVSTSLVPEEAAGQTLRSTATTTSDWGLIASDKVTTGVGDYTMTWDNFDQSHSHSMGEMQANRRRITIN